MEAAEPAGGRPHGRVAAAEQQVGARQDLRIAEELAKPGQAVPEVDEQNLASVGVAVSGEYLVAQVAERSGGFHARWVTCRAVVRGPGCLRAGRLGLPTDGQQEGGGSGTRWRGKSSFGHYDLLRLAGTYPTSGIRPNRQTASPGRSRCQELVRITSRWVARVIATQRSTAPSMPSPNASGSTRTTRSNSSPLASSGVSDRTRDVAANVASPMTAAIPSACAASQAPRIASRSETGPCKTGTPVLRMEVGTLASGSTARMTGSASAM